MRLAIRRLFNQIEEEGLPEADRRSIESLLENPERGYKSWVTFLGKNGFAPENLREVDVPVPTQAEALALILRKLTPSQMEELKSPLVFSKTQFVMEPIVSSDPILSEAKIGTTTLFVNDWSRSALQRADARDNVSGVNAGKILGWRVGIVEAARAPNVLPGEDLETSLEQRMVWHNEIYGAKGVIRPSLKTAALLSAQAKQAGQPIDDLWNESLPQAERTWSLLGEPVHEGLVAGSSWFQLEERVELCGRNASAQLASARLRSLVMFEPD